jgi:arylsulfatase A-like enzyme
MLTARNVLFVITDQQRRDSLGCYGNAYTSTPNLDALARRGTRFDRNYVANPICMPNRLSLMSGRMPSNHGLWTNGLLLEPQPTLPGYLQDNGLATASIGKIHFTPFGGQAGNVESMAFWKEKGNDFDWNGPYWGFDHVELALGHTAPLAHYGRWFYENGGTEAMNEKDPQTGTRPIPVQLHDSTFVAARTCAYLEQRSRDAKPFFLCASFPDPHHPFDPPEEVARRYDPQQAPAPIGSAGDLETRPEHYRRHYRGEWHRGGLHEARHPEGMEEATTRRRIANTAAMVDLIDRNVGRILQTLSQTGLDESTLVIFTSDHGELLGDHGLWLKGPFFYEGLISTPLIMAGPGVMAQRTATGLTSAVDLAPTVCEALGIEAPEWFEGVSLHPMLTGGQSSVRSHCVVEYRNGYGPLDVASRTLITEQLKYTRYQTGEDELTDLEADLRETTNVASQSGRADDVFRCRTQLLDACLAGQSRYPKQITHA